MSVRPTPLSLTADRRARDGSGAGAPPVEVRGPVSKTMGRTGDGRRPLAAARPPGAGLTRRERRIKDILVKELEKLQQGQGLTYVEKQKLVKTLDVAFIDAELAKMRKRVRQFPLALGALVAIAAVGILAAFAADVASGSAVWSDGFAFLSLLPAALAPALQQKAIQRKIWIYEALRELSDAEEMDVQLPDSVALADLLIDRIVDAEEEASRTPLRRIRA